MYAIETHNLSKKFRNMYAVQNLNMHVPEGSIYGFIGENGSGKSTTEKLVCGLLVRSSGEINLFGKPHTDAAERSRLGVLIENPACFPSSSVWNNLYMQALNLDLPNPKEEVERVLKLVNMQGAAGRKFKQCSLGMKQRLGVAQALLGHPKMLILDEPINGLDADGMRIVRETLLELNRKEGLTIVMSSHILGELEKVATHYGIIRGGKLIREIPAEAMAKECRGFVFVKTADNAAALNTLRQVYPAVNEEEDGIRVYDEGNPSRIIDVLYTYKIPVMEIYYQHVGLEEYYLEIMTKKGGLN